jgi:hypothetical protein
MTTFTAARPLAASAHGPRQRRPVRLTRRGRVLLVVVLAVVLAAAFSVGRSSTATSVRTAPWRPAAVVVAPHETLWEVATRVAPKRDPRVTVAAIVRLNALQGPVVHPGQRLLVPSAR